MKLVVFIVSLLFMSIVLFASERTGNHKIVKRESENIKLRIPRRAITTGGDEDDDNSGKIRMFKEAGMNILNKSKLAEEFQIVLPKDYNKYNIPKDKEGNPLKVLIQVNIRKILDLNEIEESIKLDVEFRVLWTDHKIKDAYNEAKGTQPRDMKSLSRFEIKNLTKVMNNPNVLELIWKPNLFFENLLQVRQPSVMAAPITLRFIPEFGWFEYLTRVAVTTDCSMQFRYYPADTQMCEFGIRGFSYTKKDLILDWYNTGVWLHDLELASFDVQADSLRRYFLIHDDEDEASDEFNVMAFNIKARRRLSYHVVQTYLARLKTTVRRPLKLSWHRGLRTLVFNSLSRFVEARIGIAMTTLLTLTAMFGAVRESTPIVSYVKAIDTWMVGCIFFVFLTLAEFTFHTWCQGHREDFEKLQEKRHEQEMVPFTTRTKQDHSDSDEDRNKMEMIQIRKRINGSKNNGTHASNSNFEEKSQIHQRKVEVYKTYMKIMEDYSFGFFLALFGIYTILYWSWLLTSSEYFNWEVDPTNNNVDGSHTF